ncbi:MAG: tetratricopeptide repeat protein [Dehalococcoidia bacterium]
MPVTQLPFPSKCVAPRRPSFAIERPHLVALLIHGFEKRVQIVQAPAGYGKTTLLVDLAQGAGSRVCWYTFGPEDQAPLDVLRYLAVAMENGLGGSFSIPSVPDDTDWRLVVGLFAAVLQQVSPAKVLFLLDDVHHLEGKPHLLEMVGLLIERAPANVHFVLAGRTRPAIPCLPRLDVHGEVVWHQESTLRFSTEEAESLLANFWKRPVSPKAVDLALARTGGWPAGLVLLARAGPGALEDNGAPWQGDDILFRYLGEEVYSRLPRRLQHFVLRSSVFTEFTSDLCDRVLGTRSGLRNIREVQARGLFLEERAGAPPVFRYHDLFRQFLLHRFQQEAPRDYVALHRRAAEVLRSSGEPHRAVEHLLAAGDTDGAIALTKEAGWAYFKTGRWQTLHAWLALFPQDALKGDPDLLLLGGNVLLRLGDASKALTYLDQAAEIWREQRALEPLGQTLAVQSHAYRRLGRLRRAVEMAREALNTLKEANARAAALAEAHRQLASALTVAGDLEQARVHFEMALELANEGDLEFCSLVYDGLGALHGSMGDLERAVHYLEKAQKGWTKLGNDGALCYTLNNLGMAYLYRGELDIALDTVRTAVQVSTKAGTLPSLALATVSEGILLQALGRYREALTVLHRGLELAQTLMDASLVAEATSALGNTYRLLGETAKAEDLLRRALLEAQQAGHRHAQARLHLGLGKVLCRRNNYEEALEHTRLAQRLLQRPRNLRVIAEAKLLESLIYERSGRTQQCQKCLAEVAAAVGKLGYYGFLLTDPQEWVEVIQLGALKHIGGSIFADLAERLKSHIRSWPDQKQQAWEVITALPKLRVFALGRPRVLLGDHEVKDSEWGSKKAKELLYFLLYKKGRATSDEVIDALWPEWGAEEARKVLKTTVYRLRRALYPECLESHGGAYEIGRQVPVEFDLHEFDRHIQSAQRFRDSEDGKISYLMKAISVYSGPFMEGFDSQWCEEVRARLEVQYQEVLLTLARYYLKRGEHSQAQEVLQRALASDPLDEEAHYLLAQARLLAGDTLGALHQIRYFQHTVAVELGIVPAKRWGDLHEAIIRRGASLVTR